MARNYKPRFPKAPKGEVASIITNPFEQHFFRIGDDIVLSPLDEFLISKGGLSALKVYSRLQTDATVQSAFNKLHQEIVSREVVVEPVSEKRGDVVVADFVKRVLDKHLSFDTITRGFLEAKLLGFRVGEIIWKRTSGGTIPTDVKMRDGRRFVYVKHKDTGELTLKMITHQDMFKGEPLPPRKFISFKYWANHNGDEYGSGLGQMLYPLVKFKRRSQESELIFSDRYATPHAIITCPLNALDAELDAIYDVFSNLSQETALIVPEGYTVSFLEPSGKVEVFTNIKESCIRDINVLLCGENEVGNVDAGSRASSETASSLRVTMAKEMSELLHECLSKTLIRWIVDLNFGCDVEIPNVYRNFKYDDPNTVTSNDLSIFSEKFGHKPTKEWLEQTFNVVFEEEVKGGEDAEADKTVFDPDQDMNDYLLNG